MACGTWSLTSKLCDSCKATPSKVYCLSDSSFLCVTCDRKIDATNKLASRHARVLVCEVCEHAPAAVTCKADAAALCTTCDRDIHAANPLARRHERVAVTPFHDNSVPISSGAGAEEFSEEEEEAASWILPDPSSKIEEDSGSPEENMFGGDMHPYLNLALMCGEQKANHGVGDGDEEGVVPVQREDGFRSSQVVDGFPSYPGPDGAKPFMYSFTSQSITQSVSSSSLDVGVVPDHNTIADGTKAFVTNEVVATPLSGIDREARVLRYREKRKNRKFEKTIRYASRKAYAETRPRIKGRFAKRLELEVDSFISVDASYGVVPSF